MKKQIIFGIILLSFLVMGVSGLDNTAMRIGITVQHASWSWLDNNSGEIMDETMDINAIPLCNDHAVAYIYTSDISPSDKNYGSLYSMEEISPGRSQISEIRHIQPSHHENMVIVTDEKTVSKYCTIAKK